MNWKDTVGAFVAGCVITYIGTQVASKPSEPIAIYSFEVKTVDGVNGSPVPVTGIRNSEHRDFVLTSSEPGKKVLKNVCLGGASGVTRVVWVGSGKPEEYHFTLSAHGYADIEVPAEFIEVTDASVLQNINTPDLLTMKKAEHVHGNTH